MSGGLQWSDDWEMTYTIVPVSRWHVILYAPFNVGGFTMLMRKAAQRGGGSRWRNIVSLDRKRLSEKTYNTLTKGRSRERTIPERGVGRMRRDTHGSERNMSKKRDQREVEIQAEGFFFHRANYNSNSLYTTFTASGPFPTSKKTLQSALVLTRERVVYSWPCAKTGVLWSTTVLLRVRPTQLLNVHAYAKQRGNWTHCTVQLE
jgi:hypothetical protein